MFCIRITPATALNGLDGNDYHYVDTGLDGDGDELWVFEYLDGNAYGYVDTGLVVMMVLVDGYLNTWTKTGLMAAQKVW